MAHTTSTQTPGYTPEELYTLQDMTMDELENVLVGIEAGLDANPGDIDLTTQAMQVRDEMDAR